MCHCIWLAYMHKRCHPQGRGTRHNNQNARHPGGDYEYVTPYVHINHCHDLGRNVVVTLPPILTSWSYNVCWFYILYFHICFYMYNIFYDILWFCRMISCVLIIIWEFYVYILYISVFSLYCLCCRICLVYNFLLLIFVLKFFLKIFCF